MHAPSPITKPARVASNGPHREGRVDVLGDEPAHGAEAREDELDDRRLRAAREDDVGLAALDRRRALADRGRAGRAGRDRRVVRPRDPELDRDLAARRVDERRGDEERRDAVAAPLAARALLLDDRGDAADRRADEDPDPRRVEVLDRPPRPTPPARRRRRGGRSGPSAAPPSAGSARTGRSPSPRRRS